MKNLVYWGMVMGVIFVVFSIQIKYKVICVMDFSKSSIV
jgi:hypothetical protein